MTEKQPNSQSNNDEQKQQAATPSESSASHGQPDSVTSAAKPAESPASPAQGDDKKAEEVKSAASPAPSAQPDSSQQSGDKKAEEAKPAASSVPPAKQESAATSADEDETLASKPAVPAQPPKPEKENSGSGTNKIPGDVIAAVKRGTEPVPASPAPTAPIPPPPKTPSASDAASAPVDAPKKPTASQACPNCGHNNRAGVIFCENCGTNLVTGKQPTLGTRDLVKDQEEEAARPLDTKESQAIKSAGSGTFTDDMVLRIEIEGGLTPMLVYPKVEIIFGRRDPSSGNQPDVDMTGYAGYRMGVSRRHAALRLHDNRLDVSDLGSSNGTFLNGQRLDAHQPYQVRDGDEIRLGQMVLKLFFQAGKS